MSQTNELPYYTVDEVSEHDNEDDCWIIINDKVYDVTPYIDSHPGGKGLVEKTAGKDATNAFYVESEHSDTARGLLVKYLIGQIKQE